MRLRSYMCGYVHIIRSQEEMHLWVAAVQGYLKNNGPKDEEELERRMARVCIVDFLLIS